MDNFHPTSLHLVNWALVFHRISEAVHILPYHGPVRANSSDCMVILPCDFKTATYETPQITWYQERSDERRLMMRYDINNNMWSYGEFLNRVARGDAGALVLFRPTSRDSGNYTCEVEVDNENPSWTKSTVVLSITKMTETTETTPPELEDDAGAEGIISVNILCGISPLVCFITLNWRKVFLIEQAVFKRRKKSPKLMIILVAVSVVVGIALCLVVIGTVCTAVALSRTSRGTYSHFRHVALGTGMTGILLLWVTTIMWSCFLDNPWFMCRLQIQSSCKRDAEKANCRSPEFAIPSSAQETSFLMPHPDIRHKFPDITQQTVENPPIGKHYAPQSEGASHTGSAKAEAKVIKNPSGEKVSGMAAVSYHEVYVTTARAVFKMEASECDEEKRFEHVHDFTGKEQLKMVVKYKDDLLIGANTSKEKRKTIDPRKTCNSLILHQKLAMKKIDRINLWSKSTLTWIQVGRNNKWIYLTMSDPAMIRRMTIDKKHKLTFGEHVLENPTCIVQNSSGQLIVADSNKHDLLVFKEDGSFVVSVKVCVPKEMEYEMKGCNRLAIGTDDKIYVSSPLSKNILVFSTDFRFERLLPTMAGERGQISCLMVDNNSLYVAHENCIAVYPIKA